MRPIRYLTGGGRLGHRGAILLVLSVIDFLYGMSLIWPTPELRSSAGTVWREHYGPIGAWGAAWVVVGVIVLVFAFRPRDAFGFATAIGWKIIWSATALASWVFGGVDRGWVTTIVWLTFAAMIAVVSDWPEPTPMMTLDGDTGEAGNDFVPPTDGNP